MRRKDRELTKEEALEILIKGEYGTLSTVGADGYPYAVPINYATDGELIYIHGTNGASLRNENMENNPKVCFTVIGKTEVLPSQFSTNYESVVVFGTSTRSNNPEQGLMKLVEKYSPEFMEKGLDYSRAAMGKVSIFEITIEKITGKAKR